MTKATPEQERDSMLRDLQEIVQQIPLDAQLPGTPLLLDCIRHLVLCYIQKSQEVAALQIAMVRARDDADRVGKARIEFEEGQTQRIANLEAFVDAMQSIVHDANNDHHLATNWATERIEKALENLVKEEA